MCRGWRKTALSGAWLAGASQQVRRVPMAVRQHPLGV